MGLMLRAPDDVAPSAGEAFLVVDRALAVCAVSETAEHAVGVTEPFAIGRLISELVVPEATEGRRGARPHASAARGRTRSPCASAPAARRVRR
jgi:hypothetical protein